jgi:hypothetical protein
VPCIRPSRLSRAAFAVFLSKNPFSPTLPPAASGSRTKGHITIGICCRHAGKASILAHNPRRLLRTAIFASRKLSGTQQKLLRGRRGGLAGTSGTAQSTVPTKPGFGHAQARSKVHWTFAGRQKRFADFCAHVISKHFQTSHLPQSLLTATRR